MSDRTYWHVSRLPGRAWHAGSLTDDGLYVQTDCGLYTSSPIFRPDLEQADRLPPTAHLCGNCARVIAARTDVEP